MKNKYSLIVLIRDNGLVPQQVTRTLRVHINDTDDNVPLFERAVVRTTVPQKIFTMGTWK